MAEVILQGYKQIINPDLRDVEAGLLYVVLQVQVVLEAGDELLSSSALKPCGLSGF